MKFQFKTSSPEKLSVQTLVLGVFDQAPLSGASAICNKACGDILNTVIARGDLVQKPGETLLIPALPGIAADRVLLLSLGQMEQWNEQKCRTTLHALTRTLKKLPYGSVGLVLEDFIPAKSNLSWAAQNIGQIFVENTYQFTAPWHEEQAPTQGTSELIILSKSKTPAPLEKAVLRGQAIAEGINLTKNLGNLPGNICTPSYLARTAQKLGKAYKFKVETFNRDEIKKIGMDAFLSVARGTAEEPQFIVMQYNGAKAKDAPVVLVGKGITFDSGGISLKPGPEMDEMKFDMCGAASVLGCFKMLGELKPNINVIGLIPATENLPDGHASKPGDIVQSLSGQTIEILNTDAEGRLILCDVLTYAERFKPACVIDIATLTGACVIALGRIPSGLLANDETLAQALLNSSNATGDRAWQLPLWEEYQDLLKSNFADMANIGGRYGGAITAAAFLSRFTKAYPWAHLDIAGTAWISGDAKGATGRPVSLLSHFLLERANY